MKRTISANFLINVGGTILPLLTAIITVPIYIQQIGAARYGVLAVVWILLGYFGFLDFGLSRASSNALGRLGEAGPDQRVPVLVTALYLNTGLGLFGGLVLFTASGLLMGRFAHFSPELTAEVTAAMPWVACMLPVALISGVGTGALESRERFLASNVFQTLGGVIGQAFPVICALLIGPSLTVVIPAAFAARLTSTLCIWAFVLRTERPVDFRKFDRARVRELMGYGAWVSVSSGISPLMESFDQVLIAGLLGPAAVAHYSVPMNLATRSQIAASALGKTLFPRFSRLPAEEARLLTARAVVTLAFGFGAVCGPAIIMAGPVLRLWLGDAFAAPATPVAQILLIGAWANGLAQMPYGLLLGQGRPDLTAKIHLVEVLPFLAILYGMVTVFGLPGAAVAWVLRTTVDFGILLAFARCVTASLGRSLIASGLIGCCWTLSRLLPGGLVTSLLAACAMGLAFLAVGFSLDPMLRQGVRGAFARVALVVSRATARRLPT